MRITIIAFNEEKLKIYKILENYTQICLNDYETGVFNNDNEINLDSYRLDVFYSDGGVKILNNTCDYNKDKIDIMHKGVNAEGRLFIEDSSIDLIHLGTLILRLRLCFTDVYHESMYELSGDVTVGRSMANTICMLGEYCASAEHLSIKNINKKVELKVLGRNGCYLNYEYIKQNELRYLIFGDVINLWSVDFVFLNSRIYIIEYSDYLNIDVDKRKKIVRLRKCFDENSIEFFLRQDVSNKYVANHSNNYRNNEESNNLYFTPAPRNYYTDDKGLIELELPPARQSDTSRSVIGTIGPAFTMAIPMLAASFIAMKYGRSNGATNSGFMYTGVITATLSAFFGVLWGSINIKRERIKKRNKERRRKNVYQNYIRDSEQRIRERYNKAALFLRRNYAAVLDYISSGNATELWNHTKEDSDYLSIRLGTGNMRYEIPVDFPKHHFSIEQDSLKNFPEYIRNKYMELKAVPICINIKEEKYIGVICDDRDTLIKMLRQIVLQLCYISSPNNLQIAMIFNRLDRIDIDNYGYLPHVHSDSLIYICASDDDYGLFIKGIEQEIYNSSRLEDGPKWIIMTDCISGIPSGIINMQMVSGMIFSYDYKDMPSQCSKMIISGESFSGLWSSKDLGYRIQINYDRISKDEEILGIKALSKYIAATEKDASPIPDIIDIEDIYKLMGLSFSSEAVFNEWVSNNTLSNMRIPIGMGAGGCICYLDPHEKSHGPHGLIAGMTGSGKSELLESIILMLSLKYSPEHINFFLIDYKGGGMAQLFSKLPHLCGSISNLSGNIIKRAMLSIRSENERRQKIFLENGVNSITEYEKLFIRGNVKDNLAHIFIIIDEFAELKKNEPDFMKELISVAQVGRSLGVHLILATQKPQGTVDDNIWSNSRFRICLRVQSRQDSMDMLHKDEAAYLSNPGRAYIQVGNDEIYEEFQGIYSMAGFGSDNKDSQIIYKENKGFFEPVSLDNKPNGYIRTTQYEKAIEFMEISYVNLKDIRAASGISINVHKLWQQPLPDILYLKDLIVQDDNKVQDEAAEKVYSNEYVIGLYDDPKHRIQETVTISFEKDGNHIICGMPGSGKSTFLTTLSYQIMAQSLPGSVYIYVIDMNHGIPKIIEKSNICGGYFTEDDISDCSALFCMIKAFLSERKGRDKNTYPKVILFIDGYGYFREKTKEKYDHDVLEILKQGEAVGIYLVMTSNGIGSSEIPTKIHELCKHTICLNMIDKMHYLQVMRLNRIPLTPDGDIMGRGIAYINDEILEFQTAIISEGEKEYENVINYVNQFEILAPIVPRIPSNVVLSEFVEGVNITEMYLPFGYEAKSANKCSIPVNSISRVCITGRKNTGKKNLLKVIKTIGSIAERYFELVQDIDSIDELCKQIKYAGKQIKDTKNELSAKKKLLLCLSIGDLLKPFYEGSYDRELEKEYIKLIEQNDLSKRILFIFILTKDDERSLIGRKLYDALTMDVYGVNLGGMNDEQRVCDYGYLTFNERNSILPRGRGHISLPSNLKQQSIYEGEIVIPLWEDCFI